MSIETWLAIGARIVDAAPVDLDPAVFDSAKTGLGAGGPAVRNAPEPCNPPAKPLWPLAEPDRVFIGVRVDKPLKNHVEIATALVAMACERGITPVIFSGLAHSGFERFGFRVERLAGADKTQRLICEEELKRLWDISLVVDASDITALR